MTLSWIRCWQLQAAIFYGICCFTGCTRSPSTMLEQKTTKPIPVRTVAVTEEKIERTTTQPATVHAYYRAEIRAKISGYIKIVKVDIGDFVQQGAPLAIIDVPEMDKQKLVINARINRFESEEKRAKAGIDLADAKVKSAEARLAQTKSESKRAEATLAAAEAEFNRTRDLVNRQSLQNRVLDEVRKKRDAAHANKLALLSAINSAEAEVAVANAQKSSADANLNTAKAETLIAKRQLEELDVLIRYSTLTAPFSGIVNSRSINPGDLVREGNDVGNGEPLFVISQIDKIRVHIPVPEADAALVSRGDPISLSFPAFPAEEAITAKVTRLSGNLDPQTRTMLVEAEIQNHNGKFLPGMFGQAKITLATQTATAMLPARAIRFDEAGQSYVYIIGEDKTVTIKEIITGLDNGQAIEIISGLKPGKRVIDAHRKRFSNGQLVAPIN